MLRTYSSSGSKNILSAGREIIPTTKDKLDDALNAPATAAGLEKEDHKGIVEDNFIIRNVDVTIDNDEVADEVVAEGDSNTVRLEMFFEL